MAGAKEVSAGESGCDQICGNADDALKPCGEYFSGAGDVLAGVFGGSWLFHDAGDVLFSRGGFWLHALAEALRERLAIFAALSELPFCLAFSEGAVISYVGMNMIFTLLLCFGMLVVMEAGWDENLKIFLVLALAALSWDSDWADHCAAFYAALLPRWRSGKAGAAGVSGGDGDLFCRWAGAGFGGVRACGGAGLVCGADAWDGAGGGGDPLSLQWKAAVRGDGCFRNGFSMCFTRRICCFWG